MAEVSIRQRISASFSIANSYAVDKAFLNKNLKELKTNLITLKEISEKKGEDLKPAFYNKALKAYAPINESLNFLEKKFKETCHHQNKESIEALTVFLKWFYDCFAGESYLDFPNFFDEIELPKVGIDCVWLVSSENEYDEFKRKINLASDAMYQTINNTHNLNEGLKIRRENAQYPLPSYTLNLINNRL